MWCSRRRTAWLVGVISLVIAGCAPVEPSVDGGVDAGATGGADCHSFCTTVMDACTGEQAIYASHDECFAACGAFPTTGAVDDASGNTLQCRAFHAGAAVGDPATHCPHASASGGGVCGSWCDVYCAEMAASCGETDQATCLATCASMPQNGALAAAEGNSVQCRITHAMVARSDASHCTHASITGGGVCGASACDAYCDQVMANCTGMNAAYPDRDACLDTCEHMPQDGAWNATDGNNVQCRAFHGAGPARLDPSHCAHATVSGGAVCGDHCDAYCDQIQGHCPTIYADRSECETTCDGFPIGSDFATSGDNVQCRTMHGSYPTHHDQSHCEHAAQDGGGVCVDEAAPQTTITFSGSVHELGKHLANNHVGVGTASVLAYGVSPAASTTTSTAAGQVGNFSLSLPANGQAIFFVNKVGFYPTYIPRPIGSADLSGQGLLLTESSWLTSVASMYGVDLTTPFACHAPGLSTADQCIYTVVMGQIMDDASTGTPKPVAGVSAAGFTVTGGDDAVPWYKMGPYFLNSDGTPNLGNTTSVATATAGGLYVLFVEVPQTAAGYSSVDVHISIAFDDAGLRYFGPAHATAFRPASVSWTDVKETGVAPDDVPTNVSFDGQIYPLFLPVAQGGYGCQGCHTNQGGAVPAGGLNLWGGADVAYANLDPATYGGRCNVASPDDSLLLKKPLYESTGAQDHPIFAWVSQGDAAYALVRQWIAEGGQRNVVQSAVSFTRDVKALFGPAAQGGAGCTSCHAGAGSGGFTVDGTTSQLYAELTTEAAQDGGGSGEPHRINMTGNPEKSLLLTNLLSGNSEPHPLKPFYSSADPRYVLLYRWIEEGYVNDGYCEDYCTDIDTACSGTNEQYADQATCLDMCASMPASGSAGDLAGDTVQCRITHLGAAQSDASHCAHAGSAGGGACGGWCDVYCREIQESCTGASSQYASLSACLTTCGGLSTSGAVGDLAGDTVQCRLAHLPFTLTDPAGHCAHAGPAGTGACE